MFKFLLQFFFMLSTIQNPHAYWDSATGVTVQWYQTNRSCLWYQQSPQFAPVFVSCYEKYPLTLFIQFAHVGPLSGDLRPQRGASYILQNPATSELIRFPLEDHRQYFPIFTH